MRGPFKGKILMAILPLADRRVHEASAFVPLVATREMNLKLVSRTRARVLSITSPGDDEKNPVTDIDAMEQSRRNVIQDVIAMAGIASVSGWPTSSALAKSENSSGQPKKTLSEEYRQGTAALSDMDENAVVPKEAYKKLPSGVVYADLRKGSGDAAEAGKKVNVQWVLRKSNGYFVDSSEVSGGVPFIFAVGDPGGAISGVDEGIRGMRVGGVRRLLIPPSLAYVDGLEDGKPGPIPVGFGPKQQMRRVQNARKDVPGEYIYLEIQLTRVR